MEPSTGTVYDIPDSELLRRAVITAVSRGRKRDPAWARVMEAFGLGSTYAGQLCRRFSIEPDTGERHLPPA